MGLPAGVEFCKALSPENLHYVMGQLPFSPEDIRFSPMLPMVCDLQHASC
jgi:hypothetical protein